MISTDKKKTKGKNIEVWIDPFEWENKELMKEMRKKKTKPNYNMSNRATLEHRSSSYLSCNTTIYSWRMREAFVFVSDREGPGVEPPARSQAKDKRYLQSPNETPCESRF